MQRGIVVIPKSTYIERMKENFEVFDFVLSDEDMNKINSLDKNTSSPLGESGKQLKDMAGTGDWQDGMRFRSAVSQSDVENWLKEINN